MRLIVTVDDTIVFFRSRFEMKFSFAMSFLACKRSGIMRGLVLCFHVPVQVGRKNGLVAFWAFYLAYRSGFLWWNTRADLIAIE